MRVLRQSIQTGCLIAAGLSGWLAAQARAQDVDWFREAVVPILQQRCVGCHNHSDRKGGLSLQDGVDLSAGGHVTAGDAEASHLLQLVTPDGGKAEMPKDGQPLCDAELSVIRRWIEQGGGWPEGVVIAEPQVDDFDWWSYRPLVRPVVPVIQDNWIRTPIDAFIVDALQRRRLSHSGEADRRTLIRRVTYDLIGLPPTPEEVVAFDNDPDERAYERLVDRLLASKHYGERWARHWLDVVKYADTCGYDKDKLRPNAWPYRDYVVRSFNEDKPYARFVREQIAGDVLYPNHPDGIVALGFIAAGPWDFIGHVEVSESKIDGRVARDLDRDDMVSNSINTFCSLTVQCARCHNHKFDPITQQQYYGLQAIFSAVDRADRPFDPDPDVHRRRLELDRRLREVRGGLEGLEQETAAAAGPRLEELNQRIDELQSLAENEEPGTPPRVQRREILQREISQLESDLARLPPPLKVYAAATHFDPQGNFVPTRGTPRPIRVLARGNVQQPLDPAVPGVLPMAESDGYAWSDALSEGERRKGLADWLTRPDHPLVWRSIVNRVWQYHFGQGLVATPNDFGRMGAQPTHPELLDWLACEFRDQGGSFKELHRLIVTSSVYRQSASAHAGNLAVDASNQYLWRMARRRLEAEEVRDSLLAISGAMDASIGGPGYYLFALEKPEHSPHFEYQKFDPADPVSHRRSIYAFVVRSQPNPWMTMLDCADSSQSTPRRNDTLTSLQALSLLNNPFVLVMAERFADRLAREAPTIEEQVDRAVWLVAQRGPDHAERIQMVEYARGHGLPNLCRVLFNLSELLYVE